MRGGTCWHGAARCRAGYTWVAGRKECEGVCFSLCASRASPPWRAQVSHRHMRSCISSWAWPCRAVAARRAVLSIGFEVTAVARESCRRRAHRSDHAGKGGD